MTIMKTYLEIADYFKLNPKDVHTVPLDGRQPKWFYVYTENNSIYVASAKSQNPSSHISHPRELSAREFDSMLLLHHRRNSGYKVSQEAKTVTQNQVYWYGIFSELNL